MASNYVLRNVSNIAAHGAEWTSADGTTYQLVNRRGSDVLTLGIRPDGADRWISTTVDEPARFGMPIPAGLDGSDEHWMDIAESFVRG